MKEKVVIALGGNAISSKGEIGNTKKQLKNIKKTAEKLALIAGKFNLLLVHGNGPQVGVLLLRSDLAKNSLPENPLPNAVAQTQSGIGYWIAQELENALKKKKISREVTVLASRVLVDEKDPAFRKPSKPIGPFFSKKEAELHSKKQKWKILKDSNRGYRRVVASPKPIKVIELDSIKTLLKSGKIVISGGGGGIPVKKSGKFLSAADAVIDKDRTAALLAKNLGIKRIVFLTDVEAVYLNYGTMKQKKLSTSNSKQLKQFLKEGQFSVGSMKPKIESVLSFLKSGGREAIITSPSKLLMALDGKAGSHFTK